MRPEEAMPDNVDTFQRNGGLATRKASATSFLINLRILLSPEATEDEKVTAQKDIEAILPGLQANGFFNTLEIRDENIRAWVQKKLAEIRPNHSPNQ